MKLIVDGEISGTGVRDGVTRQSKELSDCRLSKELRNRLVDWQQAYEEQHYFGFKDVAKCDELDEEGIRISKDILKAGMYKEVKYFSTAKMLYIDF